MSEDKKLGGDALIHRPLPYRVVALVVVDEDRPPIRREETITAYSPTEAVIQMIIETSAAVAVPDAKVQIVKIDPDVAAWAREFNPTS